MAGPGMGLSGKKNARQASKENVYAFLVAALRCAVR